VPPRRGTPAAETGRIRRHVKHKTPGGTLDGSESSGEAAPSGRARQAGAGLSRAPAIHDATLLKMPRPGRVRLDSVSCAIDRTIPRRSLAVAVLIPRLSDGPDRVLVGIILVVVIAAIPDRQGSLVRSSCQRPEPRLRIRRD